ncbi:MAG: hypothetical protein ABSD31_19660 [Candidatus Binataceae bacterium]|jgi:hypothetical protein
MIIRPVCKIEYTALPNAILNDRRLSADTRAMLAFVLSKSKGWELRPGPLARALSREGGKPVGRTRLSRMFDEATTAGYMARSAEQGHQDDGRFGKYVYFIGMPDDVAAAIETASVAFLPHACQPHTGEPHTGEPHAANQHTNQKVKNLQTTDSKKTPPTSPPESTERSKVADDEIPFDAARAKSGSMNGYSLNRDGKCTIVGGEVIQHRIAQLLGDGDVANGWLLFGKLSDTDRDQLTAQARADKLTDLTVTAMRIKAGGEQ